tara:strand:- start:1510 stop:1857 length:348 start_codon:yes stop_codon:yes gene_type:complete
MKQKQLEKKLKKISESHKGLGGGPDSESYLHDAKVDREDGCVWVCTDNNLAAKLVKRCGKDIVDILDRGEGFLEFKIRRSSFRGIEYAFKTNSEGKKKVNPTWLWDKKEKTNEQS